MNTNRRPTRPPSNLHITAEAIVAFKRMNRERFRCTCPPIDWEGKYWEEPEPCAACDRWWAAHHVLHDALRLPIWQFPAFDYPDAECPYPEGCYAAERWHRERAEQPERQELYKVLVQAAKGQRRA